MVVGEVPSCLASSTRRANETDSSGFTKDASFRRRSVTAVFCSAAVRAGGEGFVEDGMGVSRQNGECDERVLYIPLSGDHRVTGRSDGWISVWLIHNKGCRAMGS